MIDHHTLEDRVSERYAQLSGQLGKAADYVLAHPLEVASRSLRAISTDSAVSPATFSRLSRALGYANFEEMKEVARRSVGAQVPSLSERAERLQAEAGRGGRSMLRRQSDACVANIEAFAAKADDARLDAAARLLREADRVVLLGALSSTGIAEYMAYLAQHFAPNWLLAGRMGASLGAQMAQLGGGDVLFVVTKSPYAQRSVMAARLARQRGAEVILLTDSHRCPALAHATQSFVIPSQTPQFFSSYATTLVLIETLIAMIVASSEADVTAAIRRVEADNRELGEYWPE